ncbi:protocadherin beta-2-like isoform X1 [Argonauta hians]
MKDLFGVMLAQLCLWMFLLELGHCIDLIYYIEERMSPGTFIGDIAADSQFSDSFPHQDRNSITFSQLHENVDANNDLFNVTKSGKIYTAQVLDTESLCKYNTKCFQIVEVAVQHKLSFFKILEIKIVIEDINDYSPTFPNKSIHLQFSETDGKGTAKSIPNAVDKDYGRSNSKISYRLDKSISDPFSLSVSKKVDGTAKLGLILTEKLDREQKTNYSIRVVANDEGLPSKQGILDVYIDIKDENDNSPIFTENTYNVTINNRHMRNLPILTLSANDLDYGKNGEITYKFSSEASELAKTYFRLNEKTGEIFLRENFSFERRQKYKLFIEATDKGIPPLSSTTIVLVNMISQQNNAPQIEMKFVSKSKGNKVSISEGVKVGSFIAYVKVTDTDNGSNGEVTCSLQHDKLQLQSLGKKKYKVVIKSQVNREAESHLNFTIVCEDEGYPSLETTKKFSIEVTDVNDMQPAFIKDTFKFLTYENEKPDFPIGFIKVTDPDLGAGGQLTYSLKSNTGNMVPFKISNIGFISTTQSLDREKQDIYELQVIVKDNGTPPLNNTAKLIIEVMDQNDNAPYFTFPSVYPFKLDIYYQPKSIHDITTLRASDRDSHVNAFLRYEIREGNEKQLFTINPYTGLMSFSRPVYQNDAGSYDLQLVVKDGGIPVLSATTYLSLILTVSNKTSKMFTAIDSKSDEKIHLNLVIIIVVAAIIISVAIVVSMAICIIHRKNNRQNVQYDGGVNDSNKYLDQRIQSGYVCEQISPQYDAPVTMVTGLVNARNSQSSLLRREPQSAYESGQSWKVSNSGIHLQDITEWSHQSSVTPGGIGNKHNNTSSTGPLPPQPPPQSSSSSSSQSSDRINELCGIPSSRGQQQHQQQQQHHQQQQQQHIKDHDPGHYEEMPGFKTYKQLKKLQSSGSMGLPQVLNKPSESKNTTTTTTTKTTTTTDGSIEIKQKCADQDSHSNDVIDLKSIRVVNTPGSTTTISTQCWNLPSRNTFISYAKPLPALPKQMPNS